MSKNRPDVKPVKCPDCELEYNSLEYTECPLCANRKETDNLFDEIFGSDESTFDYDNPIS